MQKQTTQSELFYLLFLNSWYIAQISTAIHTTGKTLILLNLQQKYFLCQS